MERERFVLLGLARARVEWFRLVAAWANSAAIPAEFLKCVSPEELRAHLASGRPFSAVLLDAGLPAVDRDLLAAAHQAGCTPLVVEAPGTAVEWQGLGAAAVLPANLTRTQLLEALGAHAVKVRRGATQPSEPPIEPSGEGAPLAAVCGPGGTGASTVAIALAQGLAAVGHQVLLADCCLRADQAMLHDARDVVPGVQELVDAHRGRQPGRKEVQRLTFRVAERGYHLLLGLRRPHHWPAIRLRAFAAALRSLRDAFAQVVCDITADFEGEEDAGSIDLAERNAMARTVVAQADVVLAVGLPGLKGVHALVRLLHELARADVPGARIVPVVNQAPRSPRARAELTRALADLMAGSGPGMRPLPTPLFLPQRPVERCLRDGVALPAPLPALLVGAHQAACRQRREIAAAAWQPVTPGTLGSWSGSP